MSWIISQALMKAYENSHCSQGQEAASLEGICSDGEQSALSSTNPTQRLYLQQDKMTAFSRLFRFGMTCEPLTVNLGEGVLTWFLAASPVRTYHQQAEAQGSQESVQGCGWKWQESSVKYDPDMSLWKTRQCSLLADSEWFSETWPRWGTMRDGECWELPMSERPTFEKESGFVLPTIVANEGKGSARNRYIGSPEYRGSKMSEGLRTCAEDPIYLNPCFAEIVMGFPEGWTELKPLETLSFQQWQQQHGVNCNG